MELGYRKKLKAVDYTKLRFSNITTEPYRHVLLLLWWVAYMAVFMFLERAYPVEFNPVYSPIDDLIPFCEYFMIPYLFWFLYMAGMLVYAAFYDVEQFRRMMHFIMLTYSTTVLIYFIYPTCQELRPDTFVRDNIFTRITQAFYAYDTNTNVCPSLHVIGSLAVVFASWHTAGIKESFALKAVITGIGILICASTVFLKQHSIIDVIAALPLSVIGYIVCYKIRGGRGILRY